jgi:hypothetical protein
MIEARSALSSVLDGVNLAQLADRTLHRYQADGVLPPLLELLGTPRKGERGSEPEYLI